MTKIYFAGPLFSEAEKRFNSDLTAKLESLNFEVFLPQRDGIERNKPQYENLSKTQRRKKLFELDTQKIIESDFLYLFWMAGCRMKVLVWN